MKNIILLLVVGVLTSGCGGTPVTPDRADTTKPRVVIQIYHSSAGWTPPLTEEVSSSSADMDVRRCVYVSNPFRFSVRAYDNGGISSITVGRIPLRWGTVIARDREGDVIASPNPTVRTQTWDGGETPYPNPGVNPGQDPTLVRVNYRQGTAYDQVALWGVYEFAAGATAVSLHATAYNFGSTSPMAQISGYWVRPAGEGNAAGTPCSPPL